VIFHQEKNSASNWIITQSLLHLLDVTIYESSYQLMSYTQKNSQRR